MLYQINHDNKSKLWCGPAVIAAVTGYPTSTITTMLREESGRRKITGTTSGMMRAVLLRLGFEMDGIMSFRHKRTTLAQFATEFRDHFAGTPHVVNVTGHWVVLAGKRFVDSRTKDPVWISDAPRRRAVVKFAWRVRRISGAVLRLPDTTVADWQRKERNSSATAMRRARKLAAEHGIKIEREADYWWVLPPAELAEDDPHDGNHIGSYGAEVLDMVEGYIAKLLAWRSVKRTSTWHLARAIRKHGPGTPMDLACALSIIEDVPITEKQVRGAALSLIKAGQARYLRRKLVLLDA